MEDELSAGFTTTRCLPCLWPCFLPLKLNYKPAGLIIKDFKSVVKETKWLTFKRLLKYPLKSAEEVSIHSRASESTPVGQGERPLWRENNPRDLSEDWDIKKKGKRLLNTINSLLPAEPQEGSG